MRKLAGLALFYTIAFIALIALLTLPAHAATAPGMDDYTVGWAIPTKNREGAALAPGELYGYDFMHVQIAQNAASCFTPAMALPADTAERSQAINACFQSERIGEVEWEKITDPTTILFSGEYAIGETHAWAIRSIPMDNPGEPNHGGSAEEKDDNWSYWSTPVFKTMRFTVGAIETLELTIE